MSERNTGQSTDTPHQGRIIAADINDAQNIVVGEGNSQSITTIIHNYYRRDDETLDEGKTARHLQRYLTWVQGSLGVVNLRGIKQHGPVPLPLSEVYVPLSAEVRPTRMATRKPEELSMDRLLSVNRQLVVIGGPGSGKTTVLQHVAWALAKALADDDPAFASAKLGLRLSPGEALPIPIFAPISLYAEHLRKHRDDRRKRTLTTFLSEYLVGCEGVPGLPDDFFVRLLESGRGVFLLLDGLDEVPDEDDRWLVRHQIESIFAGAAGTHLRAIVTCRTQAYKGSSTLAGGFREVQVEPLAEPQIAALVERAYAVYYAEEPRKAKTQAQEMIAGIRRLEAERRAHMGQDEPPLISSPLMVRLLLIVHLNAGEMPKHRVELYKEAVEKLLFPDFGPDVEAQAHLRKLLHADPKTQRNMMQHIAVALHTRGRTQGRTVEKTALEQLLAASPFAPHTEQLLELSSLRGGLLEERNGRYQFMHLALQEYLVARYLGETVRSEGGIKAIAAYLQQNALGESWWREVALLTVGYLYDIDTGYAAGLIRQLAACDDGSHVAEAPYHAAQLAVACYQEWLADDPVLRQALTDRLVVLVNDKALMQRAASAAAPPLATFLARLGDPRPGVTVRNALPDIAWVEIPEFGPLGQREFHYHDGKCNVPHPGLPTFWMAKYPITYAQFQAFVDAPDGYRNRDWRKGLADLFGKDGTRWQQSWPFVNRPRENVSWPEAVAFCRWLTAQARSHPDLLPDQTLAARLGQGWSIRLPTEQDWVKAARGWDERMYPWDGQEYKVGFANVDEIEKKVGASYLQQTSAVGMYPHGASIFGVEEMSGNVWEYCQNEYANPANVQEGVDKRRALRGGSFYRNPDGSSVAARSRLDFVSLGGDNGGFRVVCAASPSFGALKL